MDKEKQIEEMAKEICDKCRTDTECECKICSMAYREAEHLIKVKGYRKACDLEAEIEDLKAMAEQYQRQFEEARIDVAREIFEKIEHTARAILILLKFECNEDIRTIKKGCYEDLLGYIAELKKKYTEETNNG